MRTQAIDILGLTSRQCVEQLAARGVRADDAIGLYRRAFRDGAIEQPLVSVARPPITSTRDERGATKFTLGLDEGLETESVILPQHSRTGRPRHALCVSSQIGCAMGCTFCETARMGLMRNLTAEQIVAQWHTARFELESPIDNVVFMGMGEPMENLDAVLQAIRVLVDRNGPSIPSSRITVSTVGRVEGIRRFAAFVRADGLRSVGLAVSINAPNDAIRNELMPINRAEPMDALMEAMLAWPPRDRSRVLIEYVLIPGVNDAAEHADELCAYLRPLNCTVNVIPYNPRRDSPWPAPSDADVERFVERIMAHGQFVKRRQTIGRTLMAACGQLGNPSIRRRRFVEVGRAAAPE